MQTSIQSSLLPSRVFLAMFVIPTVLGGCGGATGSGGRGTGGTAGTANMGGRTASGGSVGNGGVGSGGSAGTGGGGSGGLGAGGSQGQGGAAGAGAFDVTATVNTTIRHQTMIGFGAAVAYYTGYLADRNVANDDIYKVLFNDLGLDILRIANWYQNQIETGATANTAFSDAAIAKVVKGATAALGGVPPKIFMSSWSPPSYLKSTGDTKNGGTLAKSGAGAGGAYQYAQFGQWWVNALNAYATNSTNAVKPDYISIQNEPDFTATWESCHLDPVENTTNAGYPQALAAVYNAIAGSGLNPKPQIWGPEPAGIANNKVQSYLTGLNASEIGGIAHHLYNGGAADADPAPDSFNTALTALANVAGGKPLYMTEYSSGSPSMFNTAWLIHNAVAIEGVAAYIYWELIWIAPTTGVPTALLTLENPNAPFRTAKGYTINDTYYALKHFAKWVDNGWVRVDASSTSSAVKVSAFASPDSKSLTVILLNTAPSPHVVKVAPGPFGFGTSAAYRTSGTTERTAPVALGAGNVITMPAASIATVTLTP
jgi:glucuronoarabinoxylan endo-1,4-beta-xylanase